MTSNEAIAREVDSEITPRSDYESALSERDRMEVRLWLRLLTCSTMIEQQVREKLRQRFEMTLPRFDLLAQLDRAPDGLTMGELSARLMVTGSNVTALTSRLIEEGMVTREPAVEDRRSQVVRLTGRGQEQFNAMYPQHAHWIHDSMAGLSDSEHDQLLELLGKLKKHLTENGRQG